MARAKRRDPPYQAFKARMLKKMKRLAIGALIPSQHELMRESGLAYETVSRALRELTVEGYIRRSRGKGTFVCRRPGDLCGAISYCLMNEGYAPHLRAAIGAFSQQHPLLQCSPLPPEQFAKADVVQVSSTAFLPLSKGFAPLSPECVERAEAFFHPLALQATRVDGELRGLPVIVSPQMLYVNEDLLNKSGRKLPADGRMNWEMLLDFVRAAHAPDRGCYGWLSPRDLQTFLPFVWQNGGRFFDDGAAACRLAEPAAIEALRYWLQLEAHSPATGSPYYNSSEKFIQGRAAFFAAGGAAAPLLQEKCRFRLRSLELPMARTAATSLRFTAMAVRQSSPASANAELLMEATLGDGFQSALAASGYALPAGKAALASVDAALRPHLQSLEVARLVSTPASKHAASALAGALGLLWEDGISPEAGARLLTLIADGATRSAKLGFGAIMPDI